MNLQVIIDASLLVFVGNINASIALNQTKAGQDPDYPWDPVHFVIKIQAPEPVVLSLEPSQGALGKAANVQVTIGGFPSLVQNANFSIRLGDATCKLSSDPLEYSDVTILNIALPQIFTAGIKMFTFSYTFPDADCTVVKTGALFSILSDELALSCSSGCICSAEHGTQNATLRIQSSIVDVLPTVSSLHVNCFYYFRNTLRDCRIFWFALGQFTNCGFQFCVAIHVRYGIDQNQLPYLTDSITNAILVASSRNLPVNISAGIQFQRCPRSTSAIFSPNFAQIIVSFDQQVLSTLNTQCSYYFDTTGLGTDPLCIWQSSTQLSISLGFNSDIVPNDNIFFSGNLTDISKLASSCRPQNISVSMPLQPFIPFNSLSGPAKVSSCDVAEFSIQTSSTRNTYLWACLNDPDLNRLISAGGRNPTILLNGSSLVKGKSYLITAQVNTFYGLLSDVSTATIQVSQLPSPMLSILLPTPPYLRAQDLYVESAIVSSACTHDYSQIFFSWSLYRATDGTTALLQGNGPVWIIPAGNLISGQSYNLVLIAVALKGQPVQASKMFEVSQDKVIAKIAGGNRNIFMGSSFELDASESADLNSGVVVHDIQGQTSVLNSSHGLEFSWLCFVSGSQPCLLQNKSIYTFDNYPKIVVDISKMSLAQSSNFQMCVTVSKNGLSDQNCIFVQATTVKTLDVQISMAYRSLSRVAYAVLVEGQGIQYSWGIRRHGNTQQFLDISDTATFLSGNSNQNFVFSVTTSTAFALFVPGVIFDIEVNCSDGLNTGTAWTTYTGPIPPSSGSCKLLPSTGYSLVTQFTVSCSDWTGQNLPLSYSYAVASASTSNPQDSSMLWSQASPSGIFKTFLPAGNFALYAKILDALGSYTISSPAMLCNVSSRGESSVELQNLMDTLGSYSSMSQTSQLLTLSNSMALQVNPPSWMCTTGTCRRLLASSQSYRMMVRALLLKALSGAAIFASSNRAAPGLIKTLKQISSVPTELDQDGIQAAMSKLNNLQYLDVESLRSGSFSDIAGLANSLFLAASQQCTENDQNAIRAQLFQEIFAVSNKYWSGMLDGESPLEIGQGSFELKIYQNQIVTKPNLITILPSSELNGMGFCTVSFENPNMNIPNSADFYGIKIFSTLTSSNHQWACPKGNNLCVSLKFAYQSYNSTEEPIVECHQFTSGKWSISNCTVSNVNMTVQNEISVTCLCPNDGIFTVVILDSSASMLDLSNLILSSAFNMKCQNLECLVATVLVCMVIIAHFTSLLCLVLHRFYTEKFTRDVSGLDDVTTTDIDAMFPMQAKPKNRKRSRFMSRSLSMVLVSGSLVTTAVKSGKKISVGGEAEGHLTSTTVVTKKDLETQNKTIEISSYPHYELFLC